MIYFTQISMAFLGALGFAMLHNVRGIKLLYAAGGGLLGWSVYLMAGQCAGSVILQYFLAASVVTGYAEICARYNKTPTTIFLIPGIIPLVPGGALYYTMSYAVNSMWSSFIEKGVYTGALALSIAAGIMVASSLARIVLIGVEYCNTKNPAR